MALGAVLVATFGNARLNEAYLNVFLEYLVPTVLVVTLMLMRQPILQLGEFCPDLIDTLSKQRNIPTNLMFIGSPKGHLQYRLADLHGVRMII